jgi:hypothetical protein
MRLFTSALMVVLAGAAGAATPPRAPGPAAKVMANRVSNRVEHVTVSVPKSATYVGSERFDLYGVADAEVHVFIEADASKRMKRLYWIQFESYLPSKPELTHDYTDNRRTEQWGTITWVRSGPVSATSHMRPGGDREHVQHMLERAGYVIPAELMNVRLVQLLDDTQGTGYGRRELTLIYSEDLALTGKSLAELTTDGKPNERWAPLEQALIKRATTNFTVRRN